MFVVSIRLIYLIVITLSSVADPGISNGGGGGVPRGRILGVLELFCFDVT